MIVEPQSPDKSTQPKRLRTIISSILILLVIWGISRFLLTAIKEHNDN